MKKNKGLMKILTITSILLVSLVVFSGCGKEKKEKEDKSYLDPINSMITALQNKDIDEYLKTIPAEYQEKMEKNYSNYKSLLKTEVLDRIYSSLENSYGKIKKISYEEIEKEKMSDEDLKEEEEDYKNLLGDKADENKTYVTEGYKVKVKIVVTTEDDTDNKDDNEEMTLYVYKADGKWYMSTNH